MCYNYMLASGEEIADAFSAVYIYAIYVFPLFTPAHFVVPWYRLFILLPYVFLFNSFYNVVTIPWQILKIAVDKRVRKNHSLEHATVNVLEERYGRTLQIGGLAYSNGFSLSGPELPPPYEVLSAVRRATFA